MAYDKRLTKSERNNIKVARRTVKFIGDNTTLKNVTATKQRRFSVEQFEEQYSDAAFAG